MEFADWQKEMGLTDQAAADVLGVSVQTVRNYRRGIRPDQTKPVRVPDAVQDRMAQALFP